MNPLRGWSRDGRLLLWARALRAFGYGYMAVLLGLYLGDPPPRGLGLGPLEVGLFLTTTLASSAFVSTVAGLWGDRLGRRRVLMASGLGMALAGLLMASSTHPVVLALAAALGTISPTGTEVGPFLPLEQAMLPQLVPAHRRNDAFALYNIVGSVTAAGGALTAGLPDVLVGLGWDSGSATRFMFVGYAAFAMIILLLYLRLSPAIEVGDAPGPRRALGSQGRRRVFPLAGLFALDSFAGGFVIGSFVAYWFSITFGAPRTTLAEVFFAANLLTALSFVVAVRLARRLGLLRTMVYSHLPSNILLILVPLMPTLGLALAAYLARMSLSQMDVPTRQAYVVAIVDPGDRTAAAAVTTIPRNLAQAVGPSLSGFLFSLWVASPFVIGGALKIVYDLAVLRGFRNVRPTDELAGNEGNTNPDLTPGALGSRGRHP